MYREEDFEKINKNLSRLRDEAAKIYLDNYEEPSSREYDNVMNEIKKYIKVPNKDSYQSFDDEYFTMIDFILDYYSE